MNKNKRIEWMIVLGILFLVLAIRLVDWISPQIGQISELEEAKAQAGVVGIGDQAGKSVTGSSGNHGPGASQTSGKDHVSLPEQESPKVVKTVRVHVSGAVKSPGVYTIEETARAIDAVDLAGGLLPSADEGQVNLAAPVVDGSKIHIPEKGELKPDPQWGSLTLADLNTMDEEAMTVIEGVGPSTAKRIVAYRDQSGPFASLDDLLHVSGIGPKTLEKIRQGFQ